MSSPPFSQSHRPGSSSRPFQSSTFSSGLGSSSRPFLNLISPTGRNYKGYVQANQTVPEEDNEGGSDPDVSDLEAGRRRLSSPQSFAGTSGNQHTSSWNPGASEMNVFRSNSQKVHEEESSDDEVPKSYIIETRNPPAAKSAKSRGKEPARRNVPLHSAPSRKLPPASVVDPSPVSIPPRPFETEEEQTPRHGSNLDFNHTIDQRTRPPRPSMGGLDAYEQAAWTWVNVDNLDAFLKEVYDYYDGKGIYSIALDKGFKLLTVGFVIGFSTFLFGCVDYSKIQHDRANKLGDVIIDHCVSKFSGLSFLLFIFFLVIYAGKIVEFVLLVQRLVEIYKFYTHLLKIPDADIQTISWPEIVRRIELIREENPITAVSSKTARNINGTAVAKLDAHDIANRIMRQENYLIALFNKDLLDLRPPMPGFLKIFTPEDHGKGKTLSQALEWNIRFCLMSYLFDDQGRLKKGVVKSKHRRELIEGLQRRFIFMGILNMMFAPFIVLYFVIYSFFRYFEEYRKDPSTISGRRYTPYAQWKFREFNELSHFFDRRLRESYPYASMYIGQFPNEKVNLIMRFVAFVSGAFAAVFMAITVLVDPEFEISPHRTVIFYLAISGTIVTVARGMIPDENRVFDPELLMSEVITYTHYMPDEWKDQLHSKKVHQEFGELFTMKVVILLQEIVSVILTPFILCYSLPPCAPAIIDFFREFTVHVDGRGYVCSFAEFNFERHGNVKFGAPTKNPDKRMISNEGKMEKSFLNFKAANPDWNPSDPSGSLYLSKMAELANHPSRRRQAQVPPFQTDMAATVHFAATPKAEASLTERAQEYDRALRQSQMSATALRRVPGGNSVMGASLMQRGMSASSMFGGQMMAQTAVLGDSQGSVHIERGVLATTSASQETIGEDRGVGSGLDGSYVDGGKKVPNDAIEQNDEELEDGGLLGLLAQVYGRKGAI